MGRPMPSRRGPTPRKAWDPLRRGPVTSEIVAAFAGHDVDPPDEIWGSDLFSVMVRHARVEGKKQPRNELLWLSVHRRDRKPIRDWRHMQAIKNEVAGPERVGVEVYPAEADLVDTSNEYHIWVLPSGLELPFGFGRGGLTMTAAEVAASDDRAVQREWEPGIPTGPGARAGDAQP